MTYRPETCKVETRLSKKLALPSVLIAFALGLLVYATDGGRSWGMQDGLTLLIVRHQESKP